MKTYFVTGATGVVGSAVVEKILHSTSDRVALLIRAKSAEELESRRAALLAYCNVPHDAASSRVRVFAGDTSQPRLGMSQTDYESCTGIVTNVIHCAGAVRMNLTIDAARASAVKSCESVLTLGRDVGTVLGVLPKIEFVSTVGVGGRLRGTVPERWINETRGFHNTYEQSKAEAEARVERAIADGMRITVHRPSMVVGNSRTGKVVHFQVFYHLMNFLTGTRTHGFLPDPGKTLLDLVPSDFVAAAILGAADRDDTVGKILHLAAGPNGGIPITTLRRRIEELYGAAGVPVRRARIVPVWVFRALVPVVRAVSDERTKRALSTLPVFLDYLDSDQRFGNEQTTQRLNSWGLEMPRSEDLLGPIVSYYLQKKSMTHG